MESHSISDPAVAASITRAASQQTYYTIRCLVDRGLVEDAYRAYAYFRWLDDLLDLEARPPSQRLAVMERQQVLLKGGARELPADLTPEECMLVDLARRDTNRNSGLQAYLHNMMAVIAFDADRRGRLISQRELNTYTHWLSVAVTEALHYFIGRRRVSPHSEIRYVAVTGAHITHMLRDTLEDIEAGYYNIPHEVVAANGIDPWDVRSEAYRNWAEDRVKQARACFRTGRDYIAQVESLRCRIAGYAYIQRFEAALDGIERADFWLSDQYPECDDRCSGLRTAGWALWMALNHRRPACGHARFAEEVKQ